MRWNVRLTAAVLLAVGTTVIQAQPGRPPGTSRVDLQRHDLGTAGREAVQLRVEFAPGASFPRHRHPGEEIIYVLQGTVEYDVAGAAPVTLKAGQVLFVPDGVVHAARNPGTEPSAELGTYVVRKGEPLTEIVG